jgi:hypothetical protein
LSGSRIKYADAEYFNVADNLARIATARRFKVCPTLAQIRAMLDAMPNQTEIDKRNHVARRVHHPIRRAGQSYHLASPEAYRDRTWNNRTGSA